MFRWIAVGVATLTLAGAAIAGEAQALTSAENMGAKLETRVRELQKTQVGEVRHTVRAVLTPKPDASVVTRASVRLVYTGSLLYNAMVHLHGSTLTDSMIADVVFIHGVPEGHTVTEVVDAVSGAAVARALRTERAFKFSRLVNRSLRVRVQPQEPVSPALAGSATIMGRRR